MKPFIPPFVLRKLYVKESLHAEGDGFALELKNRVAPGTIVFFAGLDVDDQAIDPAQVTIISSGSNPLSVGEISPQKPLELPVGVTVGLLLRARLLSPVPTSL